MEKNKKEEIYAILYKDVRISLILGNLLKEHVNILAIPVSENLSVKFSKGLVGQVKKAAGSY